MFVLAMCLLGSFILAAVLTDSPSDDDDDTSGGMMIPVAVPSS